MNEIDVIAVTYTVNDLVGAMVSKTIPTHVGNLESLRVNGNDSTGNKSESLCHTKLKALFKKKLHTETDTEQWLTVTALRDYLVLKP